MNEANVNDYLTWEYSTDPGIQYLECPPPAPIRTYLPQWVKELRGNIQEYLPEGFGRQNTIRHCLGFRGIANIGYTIPLPETLDGNDTFFARGFLHPEMLHGTKWANKTADNSAWITDPTLPFDGSPYEYRLQLLFWPWRARMSPGWRLLILPYTMDWSSDWHEFAGTVDPNYHVVNGTGIGSGLAWSQAIDPKYNYYNIETVIASKRSVQVAKGTVTFCAVPLFDPELYTQQTGKTL
jgi:hypothetical protein